MSTAAAPASRALREMAFDHVEHYVGNALQAAYFYCAAFGFEVVAYAGPETGMADRSSFVLRQRDLCFVVTSSLRSGGTIADHVARHGDGIRDVALTVSDARAAFSAAVAGGAKVIREPKETSDAHGTAVIASIGTYGDVIHTFVERRAYGGAFLPGYVAHSLAVRPTADVGFSHIDHCVGNVGWGEMETWVDYYERVFGFSQLVSFDEQDISTEFTALRSKVMTDERRIVKFPINEPAQGRKKSQIEEFLEFYGGPGVQHIAIATDDIVQTVRALRANGVELLETPGTYYDQLESRVGRIEEATPVLRELNILVDRDDVGYMLQIFTKPVETRPTLFYEIIQRKGSLSFGKGNFKALFVAIEREQERRGTL
ncbi:MAG TPA: 4-hydroxyphenylpyruvate dioxygenase [Candidatus Acidoferrales bacterium]|nr:4-hydroxyphenylpyruvate dioxygenase [Candidatus Acidoferrales bacterium]